MIIYRNPQPASYRSIIFTPTQIYIGIKDRQPQLGLWADKRTCANYTHFPNTV